MIETPRAPRAAYALQRPLSLTISSTVCTTTMPDVLQELIAETRLAEAVRGSHDLRQGAVVKAVQRVREVDPVRARVRDLVAKGGIIDRNPVCQTHRPLYAASVRKLRRHGGKQYLNVEVFFTSSGLALVIDAAVNRLVDEIVSRVKSGQVGTELL
jgi:hypothetical protein